MTPAALVRALLPVLLAIGAGRAPLAATDEPASGRRLTGLLARLDLVERCLVVRPDGDAPPHERTACVNADTELRAGGRSTRFEDLRPGDRVAVECEDSIAPCAARRVRVLVEDPALGAGPP